MRKILARKPYRMGTLIAVAVAAALALSKQGIYNKIKDKITVQ